jgi:SSS family solute:Na+ symporter
MEKRFNARVRVALSVCWILFMACNLGLMLYASAKMSSVLFGWDQTVCIVLMAGLVCIYTVAGGLSAVVFTDALQCFVMIGGCLLILVLGVIDLGGVGELVRRVKEIDASAGAAANADHTSLILPVDTQSPFPWCAILIGLGLIQAPAYWIGNQAIVQRALGAKSEFAAKASFVWGALLKNLVPFVVAVPGLIALAKFPELRDGDTSIPTLIGHLLPQGLRGLFLAAFIAALMSSVDSYLNSTSTMLSNDIYRRFIRPAATERDLLRIGRKVTAGLVVWGIAFALLLSRIEGMGIYAIFQTLMAFLAAPSFSLIVTGILWKRATGTGAFAGFLSGMCCSIILFVLNQEPVCARLGLEPLFKISDPFLYLSIWSFLISITVNVVVSLLTPREPDEKTMGLVYGRSKPS